MQDTLCAIRDELSAQGIHYIPRHVGRRKIAALIGTQPRKKIVSLLHCISWRRYIEKRLFADAKDSDVILVSEENILGGQSAACSCKPYPDINKRLGFVRDLAEEFSVTVYLSIRSFDRVLPGAYVTGLRFHPRKAILAKSSLLTDLDEGRLPSWVGVIERIKLELPKATLRVWTQEAYRNNSNQVIHEILGGQVEIDIPMIRPPEVTRTPSREAVAEVEELVAGMRRRPRDWTRICNEIYVSKPAGSEQDRYTFLTPSQISRLQESYKEDLELIRARWPEMIIDP
ncbi:MAG: hypothetical protein P8Z41_16980 [Anaerolineales bacterium]